MALELVTETTVGAPLRLEMAKMHLGIEDASADFRVQQLIEVVTSQAEVITNRCLVSRTYKLHLDSFPKSGVIEFPKPPLQSVTHIKYRDTDGDQQTFSTSLYQVDTKSEPGRLYLEPDELWPDTELSRFNAVEIQFVAGWDAPQKIPAGLREAMLQHLSHLFDIREPVSIGATPFEIPYSMRSLYAPYRIVRFH